MVSIAICTKILSTIASPALKKAYEEGLSIWEAKKELDKLKVTIETIGAVLNDAESKQDDSEAVQNWMKRVKEVMYDAEDFFDGVLADDLLKEQMMEGKNKLSLKNKVRVSCSVLNPIVSRHSIAKKVKDLRGRLVEISTDISQLGFVQGHLTNPTINMGRERNGERYFKGEKFVIGRDEDKDVLLKMLISESSDTAISCGPTVISIDGIGGMGKTTLAHLIYKHDEVEKNFEKRWFACISNTSNEIEVLTKIYQPMYEKGDTYHGLSEIQLLENIERSIKGKKYLLVLDDVWEDHRGKWENRKSMLSSGAKGSKIIVTTRFQTVVKAMGAVETHNLKGLSEEGSWDLFKSLAFDSPYENDPRRENVGRNLLKTCKGVPLAIWSLGSLLNNKTIQEWEDIERVGFPTLGGGYYKEIMSVLKLSYDHLEPKLKQCFSYCCLYPKDHRYMKIDMIHHWIAQGYINRDDGESSFMHLLRMGFFQEQNVDEFGEIRGCKMHDIMHDLAMHVGGGEIIEMSGTSMNVSSCTRHVSLMMDGEEGGLWDIPTSIRSCMLSGSSPNLGQLFSKFKLLRTLCLIDLEIENIPPSIKELKLVRYLDLSGNNFEELPDSIANLVNLLVLDINGCKKLKVWPHNFNKLMKLCSLQCWGCDELRLMPEGIGEMASLQHLSHFMVGKKSDVDVLNGLLEQLRSRLNIAFCEEMEVEDELNWKLPANLSLQSLAISLYPGLRIQGWGNTNNTSKLVLEMSDCKNVKYLPTLSCLPNLKHLVVRKLLELEFMEDEEEENAYSNATRNTLFFPCLEELRLNDLPKLKAWRGEVAVLEFSRLSKVDIQNCPSLESFPQCPNLQQFSLAEGISSKNLFSYNYPSLQRLYISGCSVLEKLHLESPHIQRIEIERCNDLMSIELEGTTEPSLRCFKISECGQLKTLQIEEQLFAGVQDMSIEGCPKLRLRLSETQGKRLLVQRGLPEVGNLDLFLTDVDNVLLEQLLALSISLPENIKISCCSGLPICLPSAALAYLRTCRIGLTSGIERLHIPSPHLRELFLHACEGLISVEVEATASIVISRCKELKNLRIANPNALEELEIIYDPWSGMVPCVDWDSIPNLGECSCITSINLHDVDGVFIERLLSAGPSSKTSPQEMSSVFKSTGALTIPFTSLESFSVSDVPDLKILNIQSPHLTDLSIYRVCQLTHVGVVNPIALKKLKLLDCPELRLSTFVDWDALSNLTDLGLYPLPPREELPQCLLQRQALGKLKIIDFWR